MLRKKEATQTEARQSTLIQLLLLWLCRARQMKLKEKLNELKELSESVKKGVRK